MGIQKVIHLKGKVDNPGLLTRLRIKADNYLIDSLYYSGLLRLGI